jgi:hypothetical protein
VVRGLGECVGRLDKCVGRIGECVGRVGECVGRIGECVGRIGESVGRVGECVGRVGECVGRVGERVGRGFRGKKRLLFEAAVRLCLHQSLPFYSPLVVLPAKSAGWQCLRSLHFLLRSFWPPCSVARNACGCPFFLTSTLGQIGHLFSLYCKSLFVFSLRYLFDMGICQVVRVVRNLSQLCL